METSKAELFADGSMTLAQAVKWTGVSKRELYRWMAEGLPFSKCGKRRLIPKRALMERLAAGLPVGVEVG